MTQPSLPVLFLSDLVVLPGMVVPIPLDEAAQAAVDAAQSSSDGELLLAPRLEDRYASYGVVASVERVGRLMGGGPGAVLRAGRRARIGSGVTGPGAALWVEVEPVEETVTDHARELAEEYKRLVVAVLQRREAWQIIDTVHQMSDPSAIADAAGYAPYLSDEQKRELLETPDVEQRLETVIAWTRDHLAEAEIADKIGEDVRDGMEKSQREFLLRQQLAAIRKELGEGEPEGADDYRGRVEAAEVPEPVREALLREVDKLERSSEQNPEAAWIRTWLDTVLELPVGHARPTTATTSPPPARCWTPTTTASTRSRSGSSSTSPSASRRAERGLQVIGGRGSGAVILLAGPPGVGKTSLGESVARAMGRKFVRVALGGVRDEAEIRGHRRTYVGALPGRIVRAIKEAGSMNPVVLLDEVDKLGADYRGDPAAALLEVLDPAQNHTFRDHYLELDLDLSDVLFIATANVVEQIPSALLDRMELVTLDGYTEDDKVAIARDFLLPRQLERAALTADEVSITDAALRELAANYTREAGVRQMERLLAKALRKAATKLALGEVERVDVDEPDLKELLGRPRFTPESAERTSVPGVATGLAVTGMGGDVLFIEASAHDADKSGLTLTGQLGDVMKESAQIALSFVQAHAVELGVDPAFFDRAIHVHVPAGAVPKDGPSAGVTMVTALTSLATGRPVRSEVGMTGEVTLNGRVLPIGGLKQKLLAAQRNGLTEVFVPLRNEPDLDDVPAEVLEALTVHVVGDVLDVVRGALTPAEEAATVAA